MQQKTKLIEGVISGVWLTSLHYQALSGNDVLPVVVKMSEFSKFKHHEWLSKSFYNNFDRECKLQLKVITANKHNVSTHLSVPYILLSLVSSTPSKQLISKVSVELLNQISDCEHRERSENFLDPSSSPGHDITVGIKQQY